MLFIVNDPTDLGLRQTTTMLIRAAARRTHTLVAGVCDIDHGADSALAGKAIPIPSQPMAEEDICTHCRRIDPVPFASSDPIHPVWIRTNPARDPDNAGAHRSLMNHLATNESLTFVNDPQSVQSLADKVSLAELPGDTVVPTYEVESAQHAVELAEMLVDTVILKPAAGTRGGHVYRHTSMDAGGIRKSAETILAFSPLIVQPYLPEAETGDIRVVVFDGKILEQGDVISTIRRVPAEGDFRSNLHAGGKAELTSLTTTQRQNALCIGAFLRERGIRLAGIDLVGPVAIEVNVYSTGGLWPIRNLTGVDFADTIVKRVLETI